MHGLVFCIKRRLAPGFPSEEMRTSYGADGDSDFDPRMENLEDLADWEATANWDRAGFGSGILEFFQDDVDGRDLNPLVDLSEISEMLLRRGTPSRKFVVAGGDPFSSSLPVAPRFDFLLRAFRAVEPAALDPRRSIRGRADRA